MGRFSGNPVKPALAGNEDIPATDPSSGSDIAFTPIIITQFAQANMGLAGGTVQGAMTGPQSDKLNALPTAASLSTQIGELAEVAFPIFVSAPANGTIVIYQHVLDVPWVLAFAYAAVSAGTTNVSIQKNGVNIAGFTNGSVTSSPATFTGTDSPENMTLNQGDTLGLALAGTTGGTANLRLSIRANGTIAP